MCRAAILFNCGASRSRHGTRRRSSLASRSLSGGANCSSKSASLSHGRRTVLRNVGSTWVLTLVTIAAMYVLMPFVIHRLGEEGYGTWTLITAMTGYMTLMALGVPMACVRYLAQHVTEGDQRKV